MTHVIRHRGPDDEGYVVFPEFGSQPICCGGDDTPTSAYAADIAFSPIRDIQSVEDVSAVVALGHRRLAILDLSTTGHQPMCTPNQRYWIVYNGEIYNHVELRQELEGKGYKFISHTDTEVILAAYIEWGENCLDRFNGMWSFAIFDSSKRELFLARDRYGVKPLYYWTAPDSTFCFASEIKQFTVFPGWLPKINPDRVHDFLAWGISDHTDETMFRGVYQLPGGCSARISFDNPSIHPGSRIPVVVWYRLMPKSFEGTFAEAVKQYQALFEDAVKLRLRADVPVGTGLSGGLDSSAIVCQLNKILKEIGRHDTQETFSACTSDQRFDERKWIGIVAEHTKVQTNFVFPAVDGLFEEMSNIVWHHDEPFCTTSVYAEWSVFKSVRSSRVKVTLDGHGADEILAGYHIFLFANIAGLIRKGRWLQAVKEALALQRRFKYPWATSILRAVYLTLPQRVSDFVRKILLKPRSTPGWLNSALLNDLSKGIFNNDVQPGIRWNSFEQLLRTSVPKQLHWADRDSMAHSIEMRLPFLDYRLVEFVMSCPDTFKVKNGVTKQLHRSAMVDLLPTEISSRVDKIGFATPESAWVQETAQAEFLEAVKAAVHYSGGILNESVVEDAKGIIYGNKDYDSSLWRWICFGAWMKRFNVTI